MARSYVAHRVGGIYWFTLALLLPQAGDAHEISIHQRLTKAAAENATRLQVFLDEMGLANRELRGMGYVQGQLAQEFGPGMKEGERPTLYAQNFKDFIGCPATPINMMRLGSMLEDGGTRYCNHFYKPTEPSTGRGLEFSSTVPILGPVLLWTICSGLHDDAATWMTKRDPRYPPNHGLSSPNPNEFGWYSAIQEMYEGLGGVKDASGGLSWSQVKDRLPHLVAAFVDLGHVVHLIQDMSQPSHTRNDSHACHEDLTGYHLPTPDGCSVFENWGNTEEGRRRADQIATPPLDVILPPEVALRRMAVYSSTHYFSDNTFMENPEPEVASVAGSSAGVYLVDKWGQRLCYCPGAELDPRLPEALAHLLLSATLDDDGRNYVVHDMADDLFPKAIRYSAAAINYFFRGQLQFVSGRSFHRGDGSVQYEIAVRNESVSYDENGSPIPSTTSLSLEGSNWSLFMEGDAGALYPLDVGQVVGDDGCAGIVRITATGTELPSEKAEENSRFLALRNMGIPESVARTSAQMAQMMNFGAPSWVPAKQVVRVVYVGPIDGPDGIAMTRGTLDLPAQYLAVGGLRKSGGEGAKTFVIQRCESGDGFGARAFAEDGSALGDCGTATWKDQIQWQSSDMLPQENGEFCVTKCTHDLSVDGIAEGNELEGHLRAQVHASSTCKLEQHRAGQDQPSWGSSSRNPQEACVELGRSGRVVVRPGEIVVFSASYAGTRAATAEALPSCTPENLWSTPKAEVAGCLTVVPYQLEFVFGDAQTAEQRLEGGSDKKGPGPTCAQSPCRVAVTYEELQKDQQALAEKWGAVAGPDIQRELGRVAPMMEEKAAEFMAKLEDEAIRQSEEMASRGEIPPEGDEIDMYLEPPPKNEIMLFFVADGKVTVHQGGSADARIDFSWTVEKHGQCPSR